MKNIIICTLLLFTSVISAQNAFNTLKIKYKNEQLPTADAGIGPGMDVIREGEYLYMLQQRNLVIISIKDPAKPTVVGKLEKVGNLRQIEVCNDIAYITARSDGLFVVDVSDKTAPKLISHYDSIEFATGIAIEGQYAFIAQRWFGVEIVDISNPKKLRHVSAVRVGEAQSCVVSDGYLYAGAWGECRVAICDVRNPEKPRQVSEIKLNGRGDGLYVENGLLYAASGHHQPGAKTSLDDPRYGNGNGMEIYDVSNPEQPKRLSRVKLDWRYYYGWPDTWRVVPALPYAYLYHTHNGVFILDVSDPKNPKELAQIRIPRKPGEKGYKKLRTEDKSGTRPVALPFDPTEVCYSPVCGLTTLNGYMYFTGMFTDLHIYKDDKLIKEMPHKEKSAVKLTAKGDFYDPKELEQYGLKNLKIYSAGGQVYTVIENNGYIYAACGTAGIQVLDKNLKLLKQYPTDGFAMDVQISGDKLYGAQSADGLACYRFDGANLTKIGTYKTSRTIKQVRVAPNGRFAALHVGGAAYEIIDISDSKNIKKAKDEKGWAGLVYYRQLCNGFIDNKYICGTWCGGRTFMDDLSGDKPVSLPDPLGFLPDMECGGYCACGEYALLTRDGGYSFYKPLLSGEYNFDPPVYRIKGETFRGKPTVRGNILATCDRINGDITVVDITDLKSPKLILKFTVNGNPDLPFIGDGFILIPAGNQGVIKFDL